MSQSFNFLTKKSKILLSIISLEIGFLVWAFIPTPDTTVLEQKINFALSEDIANTITRFEFGNIRLQKEDENWILNDKYPADLATVRDFIDILKRLEIKRPVAENQQEELRQNLPKNGIQFTAFSGNMPALSFYVDGKEKQTFAMLAEAQKVFEIYIPAFNIVPHRVFKSKEIRWRNKVVMQTNWMSIKKLNVNYTNNPEENFSIEFDSAFYKVEGIENLDSMRLYNYLKGFEEVRAFQLITNSAVKDSLEKVTPYCQIDLIDIDPNRSNRLRVYGNEYSVMGLTQKSENAFLFHPKRFIPTYLVSRRIFEKQK